MPVEFKLPSLGENIEAGDVVRVLVKVGDTIKSDQPVLELETGKATVEVPSNVSGVIQQVHVKEGTKAKVGQVILTLDGSAAVPSAPAQKERTASAAKEAPKSPAPAPAAKAAAPLPATQTAAGIPVAGEKRPYAPASPSTRQFARELGVDVSDVPGSGPGGRISEDDIKGFVRATRSGVAQGRPRSVPLPDLAKWGAVERQAMNNVRIAAAEHLGNCWSTIPHVTLHDKADITALEKMRQDSKAKAEGGKLTLTAFLIKFAASALKAFPNFNCGIDVAANELVFRKYFHIGVAVDTERGLVVPSIRDADKKNVLQIAAELTEVSEKARARKLGPDDMQGSCFTITNLGSIGGGFFTPIVNFPEVAILGVGKAVMEQVNVNGSFQPRLMMPLSLSFDHRVIDGADGARFLRWFIDAIQQPALIALQG
jgi:pyruvate dehydrogenase E2 component (dihydrolipoamide acetyltransferase)